MDALTVTRTHTYTHTHLYTEHTWAYKHICTFTRAHKYTHIHICTHTYMLVHTEYTQAYTYTMHTYIHIYAHSHIHTMAFQPHLSLFRSFRILFSQPCNSFPAASSFKNFPLVITLALKHGLYQETNSSWRKNFTRSSTSSWRLLQIIEQLAILFAGEQDSLSPPPALLSGQYWTGPSPWRILHDPSSEATQRDTTYV